MTEENRKWIKALPKGKPAKKWPVDMLKVGRKQRNESSQTPWTKATKRVQPATKSVGGFLKA